jgi:hypothetical protein
MAKQDSYKVQYTDFAAKQSVAYKRLCTRGHQRLAACTNCSQTEEEAVQSAKLCFQCNKLQWHTLHSTYQSIACAEKLPALALPLPFDLDLDGGGLRASAFLLVFCLSMFETLNRT